MLKTLANLLSFIDGKATKGLLGIYNSLAYRVGEIERHFHSRERWFGKKTVQTATDWGDVTLSPYRAISGANAYGSDVNDEALVLGTADTPAIAGMVKYDPHQIFIIACNADTIYRLRLVYGSGTMAAAIAAGQYTELVIKDDAAASSSPSSAIPVNCPRLNCGIDQIWVQCWSATNNAYVDFLIGIHEYEG